MKPSPPHEANIEQVRISFANQAERAIALRTSSAADRKAKLKRLQTALMKRREALYLAFAADFNKPGVEVELTELLPVIEEIHLALGKLHRWMRPQVAMPTLTTLGTSARVSYQPKGRCLIIGPWNYPVSTLIGPLVSAIAAGNTAILKPSEFTPEVNAVLAQVIAEAFDSSEVTLITGGAETAKILLELPFDHIFFTGSPTVGKIVMAAAAKNLASVTLELGGKSPAIVDETADLERAAEMILWGKLINAGQSCIAPDTLFVQRNVRDAFLGHCKRLIAARFGQNEQAVAASPDLARIINVRHAERIARLVEDAIAKGAELVAGGKHDVTKRFVEPTVLADIPPTAAISDEEIFGPVLPVIEFEHINEVIGYLNERPKPLALYLWSKEANTVRRVIGETSSGSAVINHCMQQYAHSGLPFGGVNNSGIGNSHGHFGFKAFSHERAILRGSRLNAIKIFFPPYGATKLRLTRMLVDLVCRLR